MDVYGKALQDFHLYGQSEKLWLYNNYGKPEEMPVEIFFRAGSQISELDQYALSLCKGRVLDIGAGAGAHSLLLQSVGLDVTALEISEIACEIMRERGVKNVVNQDIMFHNPETYDTLLLLMNGIGLCGTIQGLNELIAHLKGLLKPEGQLIFDSSDISYLYQPGKFPTNNYYGEISYQYEYQSIKGNWFKWLYIDFDLLTKISKDHGLSCDMVFEDDMDQYLVRMINVG